MGSREKELLKIFEDYAGQKGIKKYPKSLINKKTSSYSKFALTFNKRLLREGITNKYVDNNVLFERILKRNGEYGLRTFKNTVYSNYEKYGNLIIKKNNLINKSNHDYDDNFFNSIKDKVIKEIDLRKINFKDLIKILQKYSGRDYILNIKGSNNYITASSRTLNLIEKYEDLSGLNYNSRVGSDLNFVMDAQINPILEISNFERKKEAKAEGGYFPYYHTLNIDLSRYGIFKEKPKNYNNNCLYEALLYGGLEEQKLNDFKSFVKDAYVPTCKLTDICEKLQIRIEMKKIKKDFYVKNYYFGDKNDKKYKIVLCNNHYFIDEKTCIISSALKNYENIKDKNEWWDIGKQNEKIKSHNLVKYLLENKETLLKIIPDEDRFENQYYDGDINDEKLDYNSEKSCKLNEFKTISKTDFELLYFDFESYTEDITFKIKSYLGNLKYNNKHYNFEGEESGLNLIETIRNLFKFNPPDDKGCVKKIFMIAHNLAFDFSFIFKHMQTVKPIVNNNKVIGGNARIYIKKKVFIHVEFLDTYMHIPHKLADFSKMFNLKAEKEIMIYDIYTEESIKKKYMDEKYFLEQVKKHYKDDESVKRCKKNILKWNCRNDKGEINIIEYSKRYCEIDCDVMEKGFNIFRKWIKTITGLDPLNFCTITSLGFSYITKEGCFDDVFSLSGTPRAFIQKSVVGGRTMSAENKKYMTDLGDEYEPLDVNSLYPAAMALMKGFLKGKPKVIKNESLDWLKNNTDGFFVKVECLNDAETKLDFPILSVFNEGGVRIFTNETKGQIFILDSITLEEAEKHQGLKFKLISGYYFNEGYNNKINIIIKKLFGERVIKKREKNCIEQVYKLLMNSLYGKTLLKPIEQTTEIIYQDRWNSYLQHNYNYIKSFIDLGKFKIVKKFKTVNEHFNYCHVGSMILAQSKKIMNEAMVLAQNIRVKILYQDTDSMLIEKSGIEKLALEYEKKYNKKLIGDALGEFSNDLEMKINKDYNIKVKAIFNIILGKKMYFSMMEGQNIHGDIMIEFKSRMKGIPSETIYYYVNKKKVSLKDLYIQLFENNGLYYKTDLNGEIVRDSKGKPIRDKFDLLHGDEKKFRLEKVGLEFKQKGEFSRSVNITAEKGSCKF